MLNATDLPNSHLAATSYRMSMMLNASKIYCNFDNDEIKYKTNMLFISHNT